MKIKMILLTIVCALCTLHAPAAEFTVGDFKYKTTGANTCELNKYLGGGGAVTIPSTASDGANSYSVTTIGYQAFSSCSSLTSITIPNSVTTIERYAFSWCRLLASVTIPNSVTTIGDAAFAYCGKLLTIHVDAANNHYSSVDGVLFNKDKTSLLCYPAGKSDITYFIPNSVTTIGSYAFADCDRLASVTIPNSVTSIGVMAFFECSSLASVTIPNSVTTIGERAFDGCISLKDITVGWQTPLVIDSNVFRNVTISAVALHVPSGTEAAYRAADVWKGFHIRGGASGRTATRSISE